MQKDICGNKVFGISNNEPFEIEYLFCFPLAIWYNPMFTNFSNIVAGKNKLYKLYTL